MAPEVHEKWGFGIAPPKPATAAERRQAAARSVQILAGISLTASDHATLAAISTVKGLFARVFREDQWDWFTVAGQLGYPRRRLALATSEALADLRSAVRDGDEPSFLAARAVLHRLRTTTCLKVFLGELSLAQVPDSGWLYVLSTREIPDLLKIGMTTRTVEERAAEVTRPRHREHKAMLAWYGGLYEPDDLGKAEIAATLAKLARRRALGQAAHHKSVGVRH